MTVAIGSIALAAFWWSVGDVGGAILTCWLGLGWTTAELMRGRKRQ